MPYVHDSIRSEVDKELDALITAMTNTIREHGKPEGTANYVITRILDKLFINGKPSYANINAMTGVLECAKMEDYRRIAGPYENMAMNKSGDVYQEIR